MTVGAAGNRLQSFNHFWFQIAQAREFAELWKKGGTGYSSLDAIDQLRIQSFESAGLSTWSFFFELHEAQLLSDNQWSEQLQDFELIGKREAMKATWESNKTRYSESFRQLMAQYIV